MNIQKMNPSLPTITILPFDALSIGLMAGSTAPVSAVWPSANRAYFIPFFLEAPAIVYSMDVLNGAATGDNIDMGIYSSDFRKMVSSGSVAQSGTGAMQQITFATPLSLGIGQYFMALACSGTTSAFFRRSQSANFVRFAGIFQMASAFALPATATPALASSAYMPVFGVRFYNV